MGSRSSWTTALRTTNSPFGHCERMYASLIGQVCQVRSVSVFIGFVKQNVSVQLTLLYAVGLGGDADAARIGQTERRATLLDAL